MKNISWDIEFMVNEKVGVYLKMCWRIAPVVLCTIYVYFLATLTRLKYGSYDYPDIALGEIKIRACISIRVCALCLALLCLYIFQYNFWDNPTLQEKFSPCCKFLNAIII